MAEPPARDQREETDGWAAPRAAWGEDDPSNDASQYMGDPPTQSSSSSSSAAPRKRSLFGRERGGFRIGPMVFVPGLRRGGAGDEWAHRKGEPRVFALLWSGFLMAAALLTVFAMRGFTNIGVRNYETAALAFITTAAVGMSLLWPMVRLSQLSPPRPLRAVLADAVVVLAPVHVIVWPMPLLTRWPIEVVAATATLLTGWGLLSALLVLIGVSGAGRWSPPSGRRADDEAARSHRSRMVRSWTMAAAALAPIGAPLLDIASVALLGEGFGRAGLLLSPLTGPWVLADSPAENLLPAVSAADWWTAAAPGAVAIIGLSAASVRPTKRGASG